MSKRKTCGVAAFCVLTVLAAPIGVAHAYAAKDIRIADSLPNLHAERLARFARVRLGATRPGDILRACLTTLSCALDRAGGMGGA